MPIKVELPDMWYIFFKMNLCHDVMHMAARDNMPLEDIMIKTIDGYYLAEVGSKVGLKMQHLVRVADLVDWIESQPLSYFDGGIEP